MSRETFLTVFGVFLFICVTVSSSDSVVNYNREKRDGWSLQGMFQDLLNSINGDVPPAANYTSTATVIPQSSTTPFITSTSPSPTPFTMTSSSQSPTTTIWSTTTMAAEESRCETDDAFETVCNVPDVLTGVDFWDVYYTMFSDEVLRELMVSCSSGHWCLKSRYDFWEARMMERAEMVQKSKIFQAVCEQDSLKCLQDFVGNYTDCTIYKRMNLTVQAIDMLCKLKKEVTTTIGCLEHVLAALHVTIVDIIRDQNEKEVDDDEAQIDVCNSPEAQITRTFLCLEKKCPNSNTQLTSFLPWKWFIGDISSISDRCGYRRDVCDDDTMFGNTSSAPASSSTMGSTEPWFVTDRVIGMAPLNHGESGTASEHKQENEADWGYSYDVNMLLGMAVTSLILVSVMVIGFFLWWRKVNRNRVVKAGYTQLRCDEA